MSNPISMALIPYTPPQTPMEFIRSEVERGLNNGTITPEQLGLKPQLTLGHSLSGRLRLMIEKLDNWKTKTKFEMPESLQQLSYEAARVPESFREATYTKLNGDEIVEVLLSDAGFTIATDKKPVLAAYGCSSCVALGGYDPTNKSAFVVYFANARQVRGCGGLIYYNISKLAKQKIETPIQLHLRGGIKGRSETTIETIKIWMKQRKDLPMKITSEDILDSGMRFGGQSLSIDSRTGIVSEYDPKANSKSRGMNEPAVDLALRFFQKEITLAYAPKL